MCLSYKEREDFQRERIKNFGISFHSFIDEKWNIKKEEDLPECPEKLINFIDEESKILMNTELTKEQRFQAVLFLSENLEQFPACSKYISFSDDTLNSIMDIIDTDDINIIAKSIYLLNQLIQYLPIIQNCINVNLVLAIDKCFDCQITFPMAADLVDILANLASSKEDEIFQQMKRQRIVSRICDILSCINNHIVPSREAENCINLPYIETSINLEDDVLIFPLLVFIFHYFNWKDSKTYIISEELMEHLFGIFDMQLPENETCCCINTLMNTTVKKNYFLFQRTLQRLNFPTIEKLFYVALHSDPNSKIQKFAIQTIFNISSNDDKYILLKEDYISSIYFLLKAPEIDDYSKELLILIIENNSYDSCRYNGNKIKAIYPCNIVDTFQLHYLEKLYFDAPFKIRCHIGGIFINLLDKSQYRQIILNEINVFDIFLPLMHTENSKCIEFICNFLQNLIETEPDEKNRIHFCNLINEEKILDGFDDSDSDKNTYLAIAQLNTVVNQVLEIE